MYNIGVIYGSRTCEHDVSIISALQAAQALDKKNYNVTYIYIGREGTWYTGEALADVKFYEHFDAARLTRVLPAGENGKLVLYHLPEKKKLFGGAAAERAAVLDVVMPVLHGLNGEDGTLQGMLELFDVPYTSAGVMGSAVGMDKITMKLLFKGCGFPVVEGVWFDRGRWSRERDGVMDECEDKLGFPLIVKPANLGSSIGINIAHDRNQLEDAIETAAAYDHRILVEKAVSPLREEFMANTADQKVGYFLDNAAPGMFDVLTKTSQQVMLGELTPEQAWEQMNDRYEQAVSEAQ